MLRVTRIVAITLFVGILATFSGAFGAGQSDASKEIVGKWAGTASAHGDSGVIDVSAEFRTEGDKLVGTIQSQGNSWTIPNVTFASGKWTLEWTTSDGQSAKLACTIKDGKLLGDWALGDATGTCELKRATS